jgi:predicted nuclease with TOPRIM domain|tara:strand:+ start:3260 stop:3559 length:300 start_codon:yes stop_codon:yes gene_type:complete
MDDSNNTAGLVALFSGLVSAGAFKFYESVLKNKRDSEKETQVERVKYRNDLIKRVGKLESERDQTLKFLMDLKSEVAALKVEVTYLQRENRKLHRDSPH